MDYPAIDGRRCEERVTMATIVSRRLWQKCSHPGYQGAGACREFTSSVMLFSGHNRWSTIRHDKAKNDKAKSKERQVVVKDLSSATQSESARFPAVPLSASQTDCLVFYSVGTGP